MEGSVQIGPNPPSTMYRKQRMTSDLGGILRWLGMKFSAHAPNLDRDRAVVDVRSQDVLHMASVLVQLRR